MIRKLFALLAVAGALAIAPAVQAQNVETLTMANAGKIVQLANGQVIELRLPANPSTGYTWSINHKDPELLLLGHWYEPSSPGTIGAGGTQVYRFRTNANFRDDLTMIYHRPWERAIAPARWYEVMLQVGAGWE